MNGMKWKNTLSGFALLILVVVFFAERNAYPSRDPQLPVKVTTWDALGYYMYLPAAFIYQDLRELNFYPEMEKKYQLQGLPTDFYQFQKNESGYYSGKYFVGVALLQMPFFLLAHAFALAGYDEPDGFSLVYQQGIAYGAMVWVLLSLIFFRRFLLQFYSDAVVAIGLILGLLGTNAIQYIAVEGGQSHAWIFPLYVYILMLSHAWYHKKSISKAIGIGFILGLAVLCRPTEGVMLFIPLLWGIGKRQFLPQLKANRFHYMLAGAACFIVVMLQLFYWKHSTGRWVFDVGSKWDFLTPHWRVLLGEEKGWLIYTPLCWLMLVGLFFIRTKEFSLSIKTFVVLNIWIVIAWHIWRYGASYSTRALVQSIPVMMLPMLSAIQLIITSRYKLFGYLGFIYFLGLNLFQIYQYNHEILHYDRNTWEYYKRIYWKTSVTEEDKKYLR